MSKQEKTFRKLFKETYLEYVEIMHNDCMTYDDKKATISKLCIYEEIAELVFPNINIDLCEKKWRKEIIW